MAQSQVGGEKLVDGLPYIASTDESSNQSTKSKKEIVGQLHPATYPRYSGLSTFCRLPQMHQLDNNNLSWDIGVVGVPFDAGTSYRSGARFGPNAIRDASRILRPFNVSLATYPFSNVQVCDCGDIPITPYNIDIAVKQIESYCTKLFETKEKKDNNNNDNSNNNKYLAIMGGDHSLSYPCIKSVYKNNNNQRISLIHFDAHFDTYPAIYNSDVWHGSPFRKCFEDGLIDINHSIHVGIRNSVWSENDFIDSAKMGFECILCDDIHKNGVEWTIDKILKRVLGENKEKDKDRDEDRIVYISVDIDVLDISVAPGTGTPEIGGLFSHQMLQILKGLKNLNIVSCDVVEVSPTYDVPNAQITSLAAAGILYQLISIMSDNIKAKKLLKNGKQSKL